MTDGCPECGAQLEAVHGLPGYAACSDEDCDLYNVAFQPEGDGSD